MDNFVSSVIVQQYLDRCMLVRCRGNPFTVPLPSDSPGVVDEFTDRYLETRVCCIATAVLAVHCEVSTQQRFHTPQYPVFSTQLEPKSLYPRAH
jgi:hypothetical protein